MTKSILEIYTIEINNKCRFAIAKSMLDYSLELTSRTVSVTEVADFIGGVLAKRLLDDFVSVKIVGIDNLTFYYDIRLRKERLKDLVKYGDRFVFIEASVASKEVVE